MKLLKVTQFFVQPNHFWDLVSGIKIEDDKIISETLVTHKHSSLKKVVKLNQKLIR